jgi:hypothetical protein
MLSNQIVQDFFICLHGFAAFEHTELHRVGIEIRLDTRTDERECNGQIFTSFLLDREMYAPIAKEIQKIQHSLQTVLFHWVTFICDTLYVQAISDMS